MIPNAFREQFGQFLLVQPISTMGAKTEALMWELAEVALADLKRQDANIRRRDELPELHED